MKDEGKPTPNVPSVEPWVDTAALARHIGFSYGQTAKMVRQGLIPGKQFYGGKRSYWRFKLSEVDEWMKSNYAEKADNVR